MHTIMIVDNDLNSLHFIQQSLGEDNYRIVEAHSYDDMLDRLRSITPDLFIIDAQVNNGDPVKICKDLRQKMQYEATPLIFMGQGVELAAIALNAGSDDFVRKPLIPRELAARVRAQLRRIAYTETPDLPIVSIVSDTHQVFVNEKEIALTRVEFDLLKHLCQMPDKWHSTQDLLSHVWQYPDGIGDAALVRNHVRNLRRKLEDNPDRPNIIQSRHGRGYVVKAHIQFGR